jgi:hypothetical protein
MLSPPRRQTWDLTAAAVRLLAGRFSAIYNFGELFSNHPGSFTGSAAVSDHRQRALFQIACWALPS